MNEEVIADGACELWFMESIAIILSVFYSFVKLEDIVAAELEENQHYCQLQVFEEQRVGIPKYFHLFDIFAKANRLQLNCSETAGTSLYIDIR